MSRAWVSSRWRRDGYFRLKFPDHKIAGYLANSGWSRGFVFLLFFFFFGGGAFSLSLLTFLSRVICNCFFSILIACWRSSNVFCCNMLDVFWTDARYLMERTDDDRSVVMGFPAILVRLLILSHFLLSLDNIFDLAISANLIAVGFVHFWRCVFSWWKIIIYVCSTQLFISACFVQVYTLNLIVVSLCE